MSKPVIYFFFLRTIITIMITATAAITRITNGRITVLSPVFTTLEVWLWPLFPDVVPAVCPPEVPLELFPVPFAEVPSVLVVS